MPKTIVVAIKQGNGIEALLQHLETLVRPGDTIEFLARYRCGILERLVAQLSLMETGLEVTVACEKRKAWLRWDQQKAHLEQYFVTPAQRAFSRLGVEVGASLYSGSLNRLLKRYQERGEVVLILNSASSGLRPWSIVPRSLGSWLPRRTHYPRSV